jgi:hypothetical protein
MTPFPLIPAALCGASLHQLWRGVRGGLVVMKLSNDHMSRIAHIPTSEVEADLRDAERELNGYRVEKDAIESVGINPTNKVRHYFLSAKCDKGVEFIDELNQILNHRKTL